MEFTKQYTVGRQLPEENMVRSKMWATVAPNDVLTVTVSISSDILKDRFSIEVYNERTALDWEGSVYSFETMIEATKSVEGGFKYFYVAVVKGGLVGFCTTVCLGDKPSFTAIQESFDQLQTKGNVVVMNMIEMTRSEILTVPGVTEMSIIEQEQALLDS